ncbi:MAG: hypothetical protein ACFFB0_03420 [Promethearchaeota archaeon]
MTEESYIQKPLIEQIYDEMFKIIEINKRFKDVEIQTLGQIAYKENFKKENSFTFY